MNKLNRCDIAWCPSTEPLLRRRETSPLYKRFGAAVLCATHVPPWRKEDYEPLDAPEATPPPPREARRGGRASEAPQERPRGGRRAKDASEGAGAPPTPPQEPEAPRAEVRRVRDAVREEAARVKAARPKPEGAPF